MIEDKLTPDQRLRLECIAQANVTAAAALARDPDKFGLAHRVVAFAELYETFIRGPQRPAEEPIFTTGTAP